jgi:hypothetical protein
LPLAIDWLRRAAQAIERKRICLAAFQACRFRIRCLRARGTSAGSRESKQQDTPRRAPTQKRHRPSNVDT